METFFSVIGIIFLAIIIYACVGMVIAWPLMWCWNGGVVAAFGLSVISYWEAFCLYFVAILLVKTSVNVSRD